MHSQQLLHEIDILPPELKKQVSDFVVFLCRQQQKQQMKKRTVGEYANKITKRDGVCNPVAYVLCETR